MEKENSPDALKKSTKKRKRLPSSLSSASSMSEEEKQSKIQEFQKEIDGLILYYKEVLNKKEVHLEQEITTPSSTISPLVASLLEESDLPYSLLSEEIYEKLKSREGVTLTSVRSTLFSVGQRMMYGVEKPDADVLEDNDETCLWCWETRDLKFLPKKQRGVINVRRTCRKKIHERIAALSAMISSLRMVNRPSYEIDLVKASEKLGKVLSETEIRLLVENMVEKSGAEMAGKEAKLKEKELIKELERNKREHEKEKKRIDREQLKEKLHNEKELKRLQDEAEKEEKRREKEEAEIRKQLKKQQEEAEKDLRRKEKEEVALRERAALQKQATIMERFLKSKKNNSTQDDTLTKVMTLDSSRKEDVEMLNAVTLSMDSAFHQKDDMSVDDFLGSHRDTWHRLGHSIRFGSSRRWGMRHMPKTEVIKKPKLQLSASEIGVSGKVVAANKEHVSSDDLSTEKLVDGWEEAIPDDRLGHSNGGSCLPDMQTCNRIKKLLQFDKSYRPAYYGTLSKKSDVVGPRHPFVKDPNLDYCVESDEEWEEEEPGESLSDCDKDAEEDTIEEGNLLSQDEDENEDGFFVPDDYLSENEGDEVDSMEIDEGEDIKSSPRCKQDVESEEYEKLLRQQKHINNLTEHALQKSQPLIISNLMHEKTSLLSAEGLSGIQRLEQIFLQALSICPFPGGESIGISIDESTADEDQEMLTQSQSKGNTTPSTPKATILDKDLPKFVRTIQSCNHGMKKVVESLQQNFPSVPKSQIKTKVREIAKFDENRWQVKKEILDELGLSPSPGKRSGERTKGIAAFFSKRCMPPTSGPMKTEETPCQPCGKPETLLRGQSCTENLP